MKTIYKEINNDYSRNLYKDTGEQSVTVYVAK